MFFFTNGTGSTMNVNFEVTDTKRAILSVHEGCGNGSMTVFRREFFFQVCRGVRSQRALMKNLISPQERCFSPLDVEMIDQLFTLEVLCPRTQWIM